MKAKYNNGMEVKKQTKKQVMFNGKEYTAVRSNGGSVLLEGHGQSFIVHESKVTKAEEPKDE